MELVEIKGLLKWVLVRLSPTILSNNYELFIAFYADKQSSSTIPQELNTIYAYSILN